jgi:hypothetical protein
MEKYTLIIDIGKSYVENIETQDLVNELKKAYEKYKNHKYDYAYFDVNILNEKGEDITETKFIQEIIGEIINNEI